MHWLAGRAQTQNLCGVSLLLALRVSCIIEKVVLPIEIYFEMHPLKGNQELKIQFSGRETAQANTPQQDKDHQAGDLCYILIPDQRTVLNSSQWWVRRSLKEPGRNYRPEEIHKLSKAVVKGGGAVSIWWQGATGSSHRLAYMSRSKCTGPQLCLHGLQPKLTHI